MGCCHAVAILADLLIEVDLLAEHDKQSTIWPTITRKTTEKTTKNTRKTLERRSKNARKTPEKRTRGPVLRFPAVSEVVAVGCPGPPSALATSSIFTFAHCEHHRRFLSAAYP